MNLSVVLTAEAHLPTRGTALSAGIDLRASHAGIIQPGAATLVNTGVIARIPAGHCGMVCSRSGLALRHGVAVLNAPGIIDEDYRGEIGVILANFQRVAFAWDAGDKIAQLLIVPIAYPGVTIVQHDELGDTERGAGGFGSTGV